MHKPIARRKSLALAISLVFVSAGAPAATITVTSTDDAFDSPTCNLRNAIVSMNLGSARACAKTGDFGDNDTIVFASNLTNSKITLARGELVISAAMTINGSNQTIDADYASRVLYANAPFTLGNLTLTHGYAIGPSHQGVGAGIYIHGGDGTLTDVTVSANLGSEGGEGIHVYGATLTLAHSTVTGNSGTGFSGGIYLYGGDLNISDSVVSGNSASRTGGIAVTGYQGTYSDVAASAEITRSTISNNASECSAAPCTGGVYGYGDTFLTISDTTISGNTATGAIDHVTGGLYLSNGGMNVANSTLSGNSATGNNFVSGGLWQAQSTNGPVVLVNITLSANTATSNNNGTNVNSGANFTGTATLQNSIISANANASDFSPDASSVSMANCVVGTVANIAPFNVSGNNRFTDAPGLGQLQDNGGTTQTMALLEGSMAIDAGNNAFAPFIYDQRGPGFPRVFNAKVDAGAFEFQGDRIFAYGFE